MTDTPKARERIAHLILRVDELSTELTDIAIELTDIAMELENVINDCLRREPEAKPRSPDQSAKFTPRMARRIRDYINYHPNVSVHDVAERFNVNQGRVSDALHYKK